MTPVATTVYDLPDRLRAKADPALIADDERHLEVIADVLTQTVAELSDRLAAELRADAGAGQKALDRDQQVRRLATRLRMLQRFGADLCLGRMVHQGDPQPVYVGRLGLTDRDGRRLLVDWRSPAARPYFRATSGDPMGLAGRRRYRWTGGRITDYWDEVFTPEGFTGAAALDDESAFIASLGADRSPRMQDVLGTLQADQDAIIRAPSPGALVVDGGPGTGKTVVALHRCAYLLHADPRLGEHRGGVLLVGPHRPYLDHIADVLPGLGEDGVRTCTLRDLVPEGAAAVDEPDPQVARLKASTEMVAAIDLAVRFHEDPPTEELTVETEWADVTVTADDWAEAFASPEPGTPHNEAREPIRDALLAVLADRIDDDVPDEEVLAALRRHRGLHATLDRSWPVLEATDVVADLWSVPAYLRRCAPCLNTDDRRLLQRSDPYAWTVSDLPLLDAARHRLGDPDAGARRRRLDAAVAAQRARMTDVIDDLFRADDDGEGVVTMLRGADLRDALVDEDALPTADPDALAGPFAHVVVDEAQELTDAEWQMVLRRCPSGSLTVVGDRAQARRAFSETWAERLRRVGADRVTRATLRINYRTPVEIMAEAEPVIRAVRPDANVPLSVRRSGVPVRHGRRADLAEVVDDWAATHAGGTACVIGDPLYRTTDRVRSLSPVLAKGLEFDLVVLVDPAGREGDAVVQAVDRYVAMTRATRELVVLTAQSAT